MVCLELKIDFVNETLNILADKIDDLKPSMVTPTALKAALQEHTLVCPAMGKKPLLGPESLKWIFIILAAMLGGSVDSLLKLLP